MTKTILASVITGILCGYFFLPDYVGAVAITSLVSKAASGGLCLMLLLVGIDMGYQGTIIPNMKKVGARILAIPFASAIGALVMAFAASLILPIAWNESLAVCAGFSWYTLAPAIIMEKSTYLGTMSFMHNVMRELFGIILMPIVARKIGYVESMSLTGAASMDSCLPLVERATSSDMVIYSFITGLVLSIMVPILVPIFISL